MRRIIGRDTPGARGALGGCIPLKRFHKTPGFTERGAYALVGVCVPALAAEPSSRLSNPSLRRFPRGRGPLSTWLPWQGALLLLKVCHFGTLSLEATFRLVGGLLVACWWLPCGRAGSTPRCAILAHFFPLRCPHASKISSYTVRFMEMLQENRGPCVICLAAATFGWSCVSYAWQP